jgi:hypothetical protein
VGRPPEVPSVGYAPSEYLKKQWPEEAQIKGWFPCFTREQMCFDVVEDANAGSLDGERQSPALAHGSYANRGRVGWRSSHLQRRAPGHLETPRHMCRLEADAYVQEDGRRMGEMCLDTTFHKRNR